MINRVCYYRSSILARTHPSHKRCSILPSTKMRYVGHILLDTGLHPDFLRISPNIKTVHSQTCLFRLCIDVTLLSLFVYDNAKSLPLTISFVRLILEEGGRGSASGGGGLCDPTRTYSCFPE